MHRDWLLRPVTAAVTAVTATIAIVAASTVLAAVGIATAPDAGPIALAAGAFALALWPEYAPCPRRPADRSARAAIAAGLAVGALSVAGSLGVASVPVPELLLVAGVTVALIVPFVTSHLRDVARSERILLAGDDAGRLGDAVGALDAEPLGHVSPPRLSLASAAPESLNVGRLRTDGGVATGEEEEAVQTDPATSAPETAEREVPPTERISGLSRLQHLLEARDVDAVVLCFSVSDREEFFGALRSCREQGVDVKVHEFHAPATLLAAESVPPVRGLDAERSGRAAAIDAAREDASGGGAGDGERIDGQRGERTGGPGDDDGFEDEDARSNDPRADDDVRADGGVETDDIVRADASVRAVGGPVLDANLEPLPLHARIAKRAFDVCFAAAGLVALSPLIVVICVAIRLDSPGPILYGQRRTARLGRIFRLQKFRSMADDAEDGTGPTLSNEDAGEVDPRVTRVGRVLRTTHLDEIPQLLSVLRGDMTVVGPRPERPELEADISADGLPWERRWFVKPGLTGLAQIRDVTAFQPSRKLAYDLEYVARQSLLLDVRIVQAQLRQVLTDTLRLLGSGDGE